MSRVLLVHWHEAEGAERAAKLGRAGHDVVVHWQQSQAGSAELKRVFAEAPPDVVVVDLTRLPSHGREIAQWVHGRKATRGIPLVFVPGDPEKTERTRVAFPDAVYAPWPRLAAALKKAIATPPKASLAKVPAAAVAVAGYSGTPLAKKLGARAGEALISVRAPKDFSAILGDLPEGTVHRTKLGGEAAVIVLFCRALAELRRDWDAAERCLAERGGLWVAWPKKASGVQTDLDESVVRAFGLDRGLVDTKVCAIDATWSGLRFSRRRA